jgi:uncharacterized membrane protein (Fun14 family)
VIVGEVFMSADKPDPLGSDLLSKLATHIWHMKRWQRLLFTLSVVLFGAGSAGQITSYFNDPPPTVAKTDNPESQIPGAAPKLIDERAHPIQPVNEPEPTFRQKLSPWAMRIGGSFIAGFLLGIALRIFLKITAIALVLGVGLLTLLSYFNVLNIDLTAAKTKYEDSIHWVDDQAHRVKDSVQSHLPSSGSSLLGAFAGFRRKKIAA